MVVNIAENIRIIRERIENAASLCGRTSSEIKLMGVTKFHPLEMMAEAAPFLDFIGENRVQEAALKRAELGNGRATCPWHMIGRLQRNKIRKAADIFDLIESIDSRELATVLNNIIDERGGVKYPVFIEVNMSKEQSKGGVPENCVENLLQYIIQYCKNIDVLGFMTVAEANADERILHAQFGGLRKLCETMRKNTGLALPELSMGMSGDYEIAIQEGSTIVRIGSAIFGTRYVFNK